MTEDKGHGNRKKPRMAQKAIVELSDVPVPPSVSSTISSCRSSSQRSSKASRIRNEMEQVYADTNEKLASLSIMEIQLREEIEILNIKIECFEEPIADFNDQLDPELKEILFQSKMTLMKLQHDRRLLWIKMKGLVEINRMKRENIIKRMKLELLIIAERNSDNDGSDDEDNRKEDTPLHVRPSSQYFVRPSLESIPEETGNNKLEELYNIHEDRKMSRNASPPVIGMPNQKEQSISITVTNPLTVEVSDQKEGFNRIESEDFSKGLEIVEDKVRNPKFEIKGSVEKSGIGSSECGLDFGGSESSTSILGSPRPMEAEIQFVDLKYEDVQFKIPRRRCCKSKLSVSSWWEDPAWKYISDNEISSKDSNGEEICVERRKSAVTIFMISGEVGVSYQYRKSVGLNPEALEDVNVEGIPRNFYRKLIDTGWKSARKKRKRIPSLESEDGASIQLMQAKARVAPIKKITLNRLELMGCFIAATLTNSVKQALSLEEDIPITYWSDSTTALAWIRSHDGWGTFVGNRVRVIISLSDSRNWKHVPGILFPADLPSRGCSPSKLLESCWWEGLNWLLKPENEWPSEEPEENQEEIRVERRKSVSQVTSMFNGEGDAAWYCRKSSFFKNVLTVVWMRRYLDYLKKTPRGQTEVSVEEIEQAEVDLFGMIQKDTFEKDSKVIGGIHVEIKEDGLIHVKHKLKYLEDSEEFRSPIVLPHTHLIVDQLIRKTHFENKHAGTRFVLSKLREKYWIIQGRKAVRRVINKCVVCKRFTCAKSNVVPAPLPIDRVKMGKVFEIVGVDLAGPLFLKKGEKAWIVPFTCSVYRCVHLELVLSLSTDSFMDAFARFTARRGRPTTVYCDNGTNFVGAANALEELDWVKIKKFYGMFKVTWKFNPPAAPWWGGWWERLIRSVKDLLRRTLGKATLTWEKMSTLIVEVEGVINGRPLTTLTEDPEDFIPLTPAMFLHETPYPGITDRELLEPSGFQKILKSRKVTIEQIRERFRTEYLALLVFKGKGPKLHHFQVGDVVLIGAENKKRWEWPMARIVELYPGKDDNVRVAKLQTAQGILTRPIQRLYAMEISSSVQSVPEVNVNEEVSEISVPEVNVDIEEAEVSQDNEESENTEEEAVVTTRSGRTVKVPNRFRK